MAEAKECIVICNTRLGYCTPPVKCKSISEAIRYANDMGMACEIFVDGRYIKVNSKGELLWIRLIKNLIV